MDDLLDLLHEEGLVTAEEADAALTAQQTLGGSWLRCLERISDEPSGLWQRLARLHGRTVYPSLNAVETLEEAIRTPQGAEPILTRELALMHLTLAQRREGELLRLLTPDPFLDLAGTPLWARAAEVSPTGRGQLTCAVLPPALYRQAVRLTYPEGLAGPLDLSSRLALTGLVPTRLLLPYQGREDQAVDAGLISEDDYASALAAHLGLPLYAHRPPALTDNVLPEGTLRLHQLYPLEAREDGSLIVLTAAPPDPTLTLHLQRLSGQRITFEITTRTVVRSLLQKRGPHVHH
ncbi:hypothetical protein [Deinococcus aluminii]|uniref:Type II secretion system protein GspE N-terminal domain-containing protein n=1 Tax=Deinococcus aluminii TaxID=1656885 RepID=A0ABP9XHB3_9DEIO